MRMPALFVGHGSPMNAIEENEFHLGWRNIAARCPKPKAVLCVSAHWETPGVSVTAAERPETIHDFYGFPKALFDVQYPAPGDPELAARAAGLLPASMDAARGLDHGTWSVLCAMYPDADVPVVQVSLDTQRPGPWHYALARELGGLREEGVLLLGSGNIVHNLRMLDWGRPEGLEWAERFNDEVKLRILAGQHQELAAWHMLGAESRAAIPTPEHYLPLLYTLAWRQPGEALEFFNDRTVMGSISMTSLLLGGS